MESFLNRISKPFMKVMDNDDTKNKNNNNDVRHDGYEKYNSSIRSGVEQRRRTRIIYVMTPSQHFNTPTGEWELNMTAESRKCINQIHKNPRSEQEKKMLTPGVNVDVSLDYDDLNLGSMHIQHGDCSHYCMPGVPDVVAARLMQELLG